jgi:hypothetical protein
MRKKAPAKPQSCRSYKIKKETDFSRRGLDKEKRSYIITWSLELGAWSLELGAWSLELGAWEA